MKRQPVHKTTQELLDDLNSQQETPNISEEKIQSQDTLLTFLRFYNIEPGTHPIKARYLYKLYKQFTENPITSIQFNTQIGYYLKFVRPSFKNNKKIEPSKYYLINKTVLNLSERALEFIESIDKNPPHKSLDWKAHFDNFLAKYDIKPGKDKYIWVSTTTLYNLYDKWKYEIKRKKGLSRNEFVQFCKIYFEHKQETMSLYYKIDESIKDKMSETKARNSLTNEKEKKQEK